MRRFLLVGAGLSLAGLVGLAGVARFGNIPGIDGSTFQRDDSAQVAPEGADAGETQPLVAGGSTPAEPVDASDPAPTTMKPTPAERAPQVPVEPDLHWLRRGKMTADSIELVWSPVMGADVYEVHRLDGLEGFDAASVALGPDTRVHRAEGGNGPNATVDPSVRAGEFYTYVLLVTVDGRLLERRWIQSLARNDTEPPAPIDGLRAEQTDDGILLSWDPSFDDVEFSAYAVYLISGGGPQYLGGGGDVELSSFLDRTPPKGLVSYGVQAADFHGNRTELARIIVEVEEDRSG